MRSFIIPFVVLSSFLAACGDGDGNSTSGGSGGSNAGGSANGGAANGGAGAGGSVQNDCPAGSSKLVAEMRELAPYASDVTGTELEPLVGHGIQVSGCIGPWMDNDADPQVFEGVDGGGEAGVLTFAGPEVGLVPAGLASALNPAGFTALYISDPDEKFSLVGFTLKGGVTGHVWEVHFNCYAEQQSPIDEDDIAPVSLKCPKDSQQKPSGKIFLFDGGGAVLAGPASFDFVL